MRAGECAAVVLRRHDFPVSPGAANRNDVPPLRQRQCDAFVEHVGRFTYRPDHVIRCRLVCGFGSIAQTNVLCGGEVLNPVVRMIERGADEVGESCIHNGELLESPLFNIQDFGNQRSALPHDGASELKVQGLPLAELQELVVGVEILLEVGYGVLVRTVVVNAESSAHIDDFDGDALFFQLVLNVVDALREGCKVVHFQYLASNVEVEAAETNMGQMFGQLDELVHVFHGNAELVFRQPRGDAGVGVRSDVGVDAEAHIGHLVLLRRQFVDDLQLGYAFHVKTQNAAVKPEADFPVAFPDAGKNNPVGREAGAEGGFYFSAAHAVDAQTRLLDDFQYDGIGIGFHSIVDDEVLVFPDLFVDGGEGVPQQLGVV